MALPAGRPNEGHRVWTRLKEWEEGPPEAPPDSWPVEPVEARARLVQLLGAEAEPRPQQLRYASHAAAAFAPRERAGEPRLVLAEAGTGIGKTLGYIARRPLCGRGRTMARCGSAPIPATCSGNWIRSWTGRILTYGRKVKR